MNESILTSVKDALGVPEDVTAFDSQLIMFINTVFMNLYQIGIGPSTCYHISNSDNLWSEFIGDSVKMEAVKTYVTLKVHLLFDNTTLPSGVIQLMNDELKELECRLSYMFDPSEDNVL